MREIVLIQIGGTDRPGLMASITSKLAEYGADILDLGQSVLHDSLSLGLLISIPPEAQAAPILKELLFTAHELGVPLTLKPVDEASYQAWVEAQGAPRHIITLMARTIGAGQLAGAAAILAEQNLNIDFALRLSGRRSLQAMEGGDANGRTACIELSVRGEPADPEALRKAFLDLSAQTGVDVAFQRDDAYRRTRRLVAFDMDSTLIQVEVIDELAAEAGAGERVRAITEAAMRGELDFRQSLAKRLSLLEGLDAAVLENVYERLPLTEGAERCIGVLKRLGYTVAIISGGFTYFGNRLADRLGIDHVFANELEIVNGKLTGKVVGGIVDAARKAEILAELAEGQGLSLQQVIAVGDGANDLPMLSKAGLGIAFHAKPVVKAGARQSISNLGLDSILYMIGVRDRDAEVL